MDAKTYQLEASRTLIEGPERPLTAEQHMIVWNVLGLVGEAGEVWYLAQDNKAAEAILWRASQLTEHVKKAIFHEQGLNLELVASQLERIGRSAAALWASQPKGAAYEQLLRKELGDLLWYLAALCTKLGWDLDDVVKRQDARHLAGVMDANIAKLRTRFPAGWSVADAAARVDVAPPPDSGDVRIGQGGRA